MDDAYVVPKGELGRLPITNTGMVTFKNKVKKNSFIDDFIKQKAFVPSPEKY